jgi:hypothetical protein
MHNAVLISMAVLICLAAIRLWVAYRLGELRAARQTARHIRPR